jgi:hypothetical protein
LENPHFEASQESISHNELLTQIKTQFPTQFSYHPAVTDNRELNSYYNAADSFISLSTHHGEFMGAAALEAALTGLPLILTEWGGHKDFCDYLASPIHYIKIAPHEKKIEIDQSQIITHLLRFSSLSNAARDNNSKKNHEWQSGLESLNQEVLKKHIDLISHGSTAHTKLTTLCPQEKALCFGPTNYRQKNYQDVFSSFYPNLDLT